MKIILHVIAYLMIINGIWLTITSLPFAWGSGVFNGGSTAALVDIMSELSLLIIYFGFRELFNR
ncbi:MAG: hypothetical protein ACYCTB_10615 [bacterium]